MRESGFSRVLLIVAVLVILVGVVGGAWYFRQGRWFEDVRYTNRFPNPRFPYCSMENGCPKDKCQLVSNCGGGGEGFGCVLGEDTCEYKSYVLKDQYQEVSPSRVRQCVADFIASNQDTYPLLAGLIFDEQETARESYGCGLGGEYVGKDSYCYFVAMKHKSGRLPVASHFYVGAQTCQVYWQLSEVYKVDDPNLTINGVLYTPLQAVACAEQYITAHRGEYLEYQNYIPGSLRATNPPGPHAKVDDLSKDWSFYTVAMRSLYFAVGAHTCTVYPVNEKYYTKL